MMVRIEWEKIEACCLVASVSLLIRNALSLLSLSLTLSLSLSFLSLVSFLLESHAYLSYSYPSPIPSLSAVDYPDMMNRHPAVGRASDV